MGRGGEIGSITSEINSDQKEGGGVPQPHHCDVFQKNKKTITYMHPYVYAYLYAYYQYVYLYVYMYVFDALDRRSIRVHVCVCIRACVRF